jgi:uncharacterized membrane protein
MRVLLCGESWVTHSLHVKGVDSFGTSSYVEGAGQLSAALAGADVQVDYLPGHLVPGQFPATAGDLDGYDAVSSATSAPTACCLRRRPSSSPAAPPTGSTR